VRLTKCEGMDYVTVRNACVLDIDVLPS
jgi:hypothetical protein